MISGWIRSNLGPFGVILDFFAAHPEILTVILVVWMALYAAGRIQLKLIEQRSVRLVLERGRGWVAANPQISLAELREKFLLAWQEELEKWNFYFIPHKFDFWPVAVTSKNVLVKLPLSLDWLALVLKNGGIVMENAPVNTPQSPKK